MTSKINLISSVGFPYMIKDMRGRLSNKADYIRYIWLMYNLHQPYIIVIRDYNPVPYVRDQDDKDLKSEEKILLS